MFVKRCSLCNGKLNSKKICTECGLDNSKSEKYYKINQSSCDRKPLTHVHEEKKQRSYKQTTPQKPVKKKTTGYHGENEKPVSGKIVCTIVTIVIIISILPSVLGTFFVFNEPEPDYAVEEVYTDPYEYLDVEHPIEGEYYSCTLKAGEYVVGTHIPEGDYFATTFDEYDVIQVEDRINGIFLYEYEANEYGNYLHDIRLFNGAVVTIFSDVGILIKSDNAQFSSQTNVMENPVKEEFLAEMHVDLTAGEDFEPGIYDVYVSDEYAYFIVLIHDENGYEIMDKSMDLEMQGDQSASYYNLVLPEGAVIHCQESSVLLVPSGMVSTTDYLEYYY